MSEHDTSPDQVHGILGRNDRLILGDREEIAAFFAVVAAQLEPDGPGTRFPVSRKLIDGVIPIEDAEASLAEFEQIQQELRPVASEREVPGIEHATWDWLSPEGRFISVRGADLVDWLVDAAWANARKEGSAMHVVFPAFANAPS